MPMIIQCACGQSMQAPDNAVGKHVRCPKCQAAVLVAAPPTERPAPPANGTTEKVSGTAPKPAAPMAAAPKASAPKPTAPKSMAPKPAAPKTAPPTPAPPTPAAPVKRGKRRALLLVGCLGLVLLSCVSTVAYGVYYAYNAITGAVTTIESQIKAEVAKGPDLAQPVDTKTKDNKVGDGQSTEDSKSPAKKLQPGVPLKLEAQAYSRILGVCANAKGVVVTGGSDGDVRVWDPVSWTVKKKASPGYVTTLDVSANGTTAVFFTSKVVDGIAKDLKIWRWDWDKDAEPTVIATPKKSPERIAVTPDGKVAVWDEWSDNNRLVVWDLEKNTERTRLDGLYRSYLEALPINADATEFVSVTSDVSEWWRLKPKQPGTRFKIHEAKAAAFINPTTLLVGTFEKQAIVWDLTKMQKVKEMPLPGPARQAVRSADGKRLAVAALKGVVVYGISGEIKPLGTVTMPAEHSAERVALDGPGNVLITAGTLDDNCLVWDISQLK